MTQAIRFAYDSPLTSPVVYLFDAAGAVVGEAAGYVPVEVSEGQWVITVADGLSGSPLSLKLYLAGSFETSDFVHLTGDAGSTAVVGNTGPVTVNAVSSETLTAIADSVGAISALNDSQAAQLAAVYGITSQIILGDIDISMPTVDPATGDLELNAGSDYSIADGTQIDVPITTAADITDAVITWAAEMGDQRVEGLGTVTSAATPKAVSLEATNVDTDKAEGRYEYAIVATWPATSRRHTIRRGFLSLRARIVD